VVAATLLSAHAQQLRNHHRRLFGARGRADAGFLALHAEGVSGHAERMTMRRLVDVWIDALHANAGRWILAAGS